MDDRTTWDLSAIVAKWLMKSKRFMTFAEEIVPRFYEHLYWMLRIGQNTTARTYSNLHSTDFRIPA